MMSIIIQRCYAQQQLLLCAIICIIWHHKSVASASSSAFVPSVSSRIFRCTDTVQPQYLHNKSIICLSATSNDSGNTGGNTSKSARERGIYSRPSAAIERGSGFFVPGLEGSRIRLIFGMIVLIADGTSHALIESMPGDWGQVVAEVLAAFYGALLVLQGSIEMGVERGFALKGDSNSGSEGIISIENEDGIIQNRGSRVAEALKGDEDTISTIQRMAQTIISFTPATYFQFVSEDLGVLYSFGVGNDAATIDINEQTRMAKLSLDAVSGSKGGRVALPSDHPASKLLPEEATRCILVQKVNDYQGSRACMVIGSDKLLPSFTKNDLRWIGQLAEYNSLMGIES